MPATPRAPAAAHDAALSGVTPPMAITGTGDASATAASILTPAAATPGYESLSNTVPNTKKSGGGDSDVSSMA